MLIFKRVCVIYFTKYQVFNNKYKVARRKREARKSDVCYPLLFGEGAYLETKEVR